MIPTPPPFSLAGKKCAVIFLLPSCSLKGSTEISVLAKPPRTLRYRLRTDTPVLLCQPAGDLKEEIWSIPFILVKDPPNHIERLDRNAQLFSSVPTTFVMDGRGVSGRKLLRPEAGLSGGHVGAGREMEIEKRSF